MTPDPSFPRRSRGRVSFRSRGIPLLLLALVLLAGCASGQRRALRAPAGREFNGLASWYGRPYHGRATASGERYNMEDLTAAHRTLPFNTRVRVDRTDNGRSVKVRINDRGPFVEGRVIDLSKRAARRLGILQKGVAPVRLVPVSYPPARPHRWMVLVGNFRNNREAVRLAGRMRSRYPGAKAEPGWHGDNAAYRVQLPGIATRRKAEAEVERLRRAGYSAFLVRTP